MQEIIEKLNLYTSNVQLSIAGDLYDSTRYSEDFLIDILDIVYQLNLKNMNSFQSNYPSIDLGDLEKKVAFQITAERSARKVRKTIEKFETHDLKKKFDELFIYFISAEACPNPKVETDIEYVTLNTANLIAKIRVLDTADLIKINNYLNEALQKPEIQSEGLGIRPKGFVDYFKNLDTSDFSEKYYIDDDNMTKNQLNDLFNKLHILSREERELIYYIASNWDQNREESITVPDAVLSSKYESYEIRRYLDNLRHNNMLEVDDDYEPHRDNRYCTGYSVFYYGKYDDDILAPLYKYLGQDDFYNFIVRLDESIIA